jgi:hypothetical protein
MAEDLPPVDSDPKTQQALARVSALEYELAERSCYPLFSATVSLLGCKPEMIHDLWILSGYEPTDPPDEEAIKDLAVRLSESKPGFFDPSARVINKGNPDQDASDIIADDDERLQDAGWQMANQDKIVASAKARLARGDFD